MLNQDLVRSEVFQGTLKTIPDKKKVHDNQENSILEKAQTKISLYCSL